MTVTTPAGTSATSAADQFTYTVATAPTVTAISPTSGPPAGGTLVTITGTGFTGATAVDFGTVPVTNFTVASDTTITAASPAGTGTVDVTVTTPAGTSATSAADQFTYTAAVAPTVTEIGPTSGPETGGTLVTITGTGFTDATAVDFGTVPATSFTVANDTTITAASPAGTGTVDVTVTTPAGTSATSPADQFTYTVVAAPTVTGVSPASGPEIGGTLVTISGAGFTGTTAVNFGTTPAASFTVVNDSTITAATPAGTGIVDVTVTTALGTSPTSPADQFTFATTTGPTVVSLARFGFHMQPTSLVLTFSSPLAAGPAENVANYQILTPSGAVVPISSAVYDPASLTVTLYPAQLLNVHDVYQLTVNGMPPNGLTSDTGVPLDGAGNGTPGTDYVAMFSGDNLVGPDPAMLVSNPKKYFAEAKYVAVVHKEMVAQAKRLAAAERKIEAAAKRLAAKTARVNGTKAAAVDHVLGSKSLSVKKIAARRRQARR